MFDAATVNPCDDPPARVPLTAVCAVKLSPPWLSGTHQLRDWWHEIHTLLERSYCGDNFASVLDSGDASICLDLACVNGWQALYPIARKDEVVAALQAEADKITQAAGVEPLLIELVPVEAGIWGDSDTQVELYDFTEFDVETGELVR